MPCTAILFFGFVARYLDCKQENKEVGENSFKPKPRENTISLSYFFSFSQYYLTLLYRWKQYAVGHLSKNYYRLDGNLDRS